MAALSDQNPTEPSSVGRSTVSLGARIVGILLLVAVLVAGIAGSVAITAVQRTAREANSARLQQEADLLTVELARSRGSAAVGTDLLTVLARQGFLVVTFAQGRPLTGDAAAVEVVRAAGLLTADPTLPASRSVVVQANAWLVEARQVPGGAGRGELAFAVIADADDGAVSSRVLLRRILIAMLIGLGVAIPAGLVLAQLVTRPLRRTVDVAHAMGAGRRDLRVEPGGPAEVREVAVAVNQLADALAGSEARQQRFLASVSHELRTPLAAVAGLSDALADGLIADHEAPAIGRTIRAEAARLERLVADLLDLARLRTGEFSLDLVPVDVHQVVRGMATVWQVRCDQRGVPLRITADPLGGVAMVDERRLRQVLDGLAENALRQLQPGQPLIVESATLPARYGEPTRVRIEIRDGGPGLTAEDYRVAFEPGVLHERYRASRPSGAGLGLALAQGLITRMGGRLSLGPAPEGGVCCTVVLPTTEPVTR